MFQYEIKTQKLGYDYIIGCDEVGRGSLAGPVVAGAVLFKIKELVAGKKREWFKDVRDSKRLTPVSRTVLNTQLMLHAQGYATARVSHTKIDRINIHNASLQAMHNAVQEVLKISKCNPSKVLVCVDGKFAIPKLHVAQEAVVNGDDLVFSVSAASIIAKVYRDHFMMKLDAKFPKYYFGKHKGYGTQVHIKALRKHGLSPLHRQSFCKNYK